MELTSQNCRQSITDALKTAPIYTAQGQGRGIVICAGGILYLTNLWITVHMLRWLGCSLPIQVWHLGDSEVHPDFAELCQHLQLQWVDGLQVGHQFGFSSIGGWELKALAVFACAFDEVLLLDADNIPVRNPEYLFDTKEFGVTGAIFWPDVLNWSPTDPVWALFDVLPTTEPQFESGQIVVNKQRCWSALWFSVWLNHHSAFFYRYVHGDKDLFGMAFRKVGCSYKLACNRVGRLRGALCQYDFDGKRLFQHRAGAKWMLLGENAQIPGFWHEARCFRWLACLRSQWHPKLKVRVFGGISASTDVEKVVAYLTEHVFLLRCEGGIYTHIAFLRSGRIGIGAGASMVFWNVDFVDDSAWLTISSEDQVVWEFSSQDWSSWAGGRLGSKVFRGTLAPVSTLRNT